MMRFSSIILISILLISCEKQLFDYRNKYIGNWEFNVSNSHEVFNNTQGFHDTTITVIYHGEIRYGSEDRTILFQSKDYSQEFTIDKNGNIIPTLIFGPNYTESGAFEGKNVFRYHFYHQSGGTPHKYQSTDIYGLRE